MYGEQQVEKAAKINKWLNYVDDAFSDGLAGAEFYQILSGSVRGPDTGAGKSNTTMRLRRICFPKTCSQGNTGMMSTGGVPVLSPGDGTGHASGHFAGHVSQAISYLKGIGRIPAEGGNAAAAKKG